MIGDELSGDEWSEGEGAGPEPNAALQKLESEYGSASPRGKAFEDEQEEQNGNGKIGDLKGMGKKMIGELSAWKTCLQKTKTFTENAKAVLGTKEVTHYVELQIVGITDLPRSSICNPDTTHPYVEVRGSAGQFFKSHAHRMESTGVTYKEHSRFEIYDIEDDHFTGSIFGLQMSGMKAEAEVVDTAIEDEDGDDWPIDKLGTFDFPASRLRKGDNELRCSVELVDDLQNLGSDSIVHMVAKLIPVKKDALSEVVEKIDYSGWVINVADTLDRLEKRALKFEAFRGLSFFMVFFIIYVVMVNAQLNTSASFVLEEGLRSTIKGLSTGVQVDETTGVYQQDISWENMHGVEDFWDWIVRACVPAIYTRMKCALPPPPPRAHTGGAGPYFAFRSGGHCFVNSGSWFHSARA